MMELTAELKTDIKGLDFNGLATLETGEVLNGLDYDKLLKKYASRFQIYQKDFSQYLFRPHAVGHLMGGIPKPLTERQAETLSDFQAKLGSGKGLTEKQYITYGSLLEKKNAKPTLSTGAKSYLKQLFKEITFQRTSEIKSKYLDKGLAVEGASIAMLNDFLGQDYQKNQERFNNDYFTGEPDIITADAIIDIKSSWDYTTFPMIDEEIHNKLYYWQILAYMDLLGLNKGKVIFVLADTPYDIIVEEKRRVSWQLGLINDELKFDLPEDLEFEIERNLTYSDIPTEARIKIFEFERNEKDLAMLKAMIELAREYLRELNQEMDSRFTTEKQRI